MTQIDHQTSLIVIDENDVFRRGLIVQLEEQSDLCVLADARDLDAGIAQVLVHEPRVVVMEVLFSGKDPFAASQTILNRRPDSRILFLTSCHHDVYIEHALQNHAWGYLTKNDSLVTICKAIRAVARGKTFFSPAISKRIVVRSDGRRLTGMKTTRLKTLTTRELQVLRHLAEGMSTREIADAMSISNKTVENHKSNLMTKVGIHDRVKLARYAFREGLVIP